MTSWSIRIIVASVIHYLSFSDDVQGYLIPNLPNIVQNNQMIGWNHLDFIWGMHAASQIYQPIVTVMNAS